MSIDFESVKIPLPIPCQASSFLCASIRSKIKMREYPIALPLTTSTGTAITNSNGIYTIAASGASTKYFYISWDGSVNGEILGIKYTVDASVELIGNLEVYVGSAWIPIPDHTNTVAAGGASQKWNGKYVNRELITTGTKMRISTTVDGAADIYCQVIGFKS